MEGRALSSSEDCSCHSVLVSRYGIASMWMGYLAGWELPGRRRRRWMWSNFWRGVRRNVGPRAALALSSDVESDK